MKVRMFCGYNVNELQNDINDFISELKDLVDIKITCSPDEEGESWMVAMVIYKCEE